MKKNYTCALSVFTRARVRVSIHTYAVGYYNICYNTALLGQIYI